MAEHPGMGEFVTYEALVRALEAQTKRFEEMFDRATLAMERAADRNRWQRDALMVLAGLTVAAVFTFYVERAAPAPSGEPEFIQPHDYNRRK